MKAEKTRKALKIMIMATDLPIPDFESKKVDEELEEIERKAEEFDKREHGALIVEEEVNGQSYLMCSNCGALAANTYCDNCGYRLNFRESNGES